jgi:integrase
MPYKREDSPIYWASYTDPSGKRVRRSTGTTKRKEAVAIEAKWKLEAHEERQWGREPDRSIEEVMLAFLTAHGGMRSIERSKGHARHWRRLLPGMSMQAMRPANVQGFINACRNEGVSDSTINREMATLQAALNWCNKALGWNLPNPIRGRFLKEPEGRLRWLTPAEAERLLAVAGTVRRPPYLQDFIRLALNTGMRRGEMLGLEWERVDLQRRVHAHEDRKKAISAVE